jgi:hypothetical protein
VRGQPWAGRQKRVSGEGGSNRSYGAGLAWVGFWKCTISSYGKTECGLEFRYGWTIDPQEFGLQTRLECSQDRSRSPEMFPYYVKERRFVRFPDRLGTDSSAIIA